MDERDRVEEEATIIRDEDEHAEEVARRIHEAVEVDIRGGAVPDEAATVEEPAVNEELTAALRAQIEAQTETMVEAVRQGNLTFNTDLIGEFPAPEPIAGPVDGFPIHGHQITTGTIDTGRLTVTGNMHFAQPQQAFTWRPRVNYKIDWKKVNSVQDMILILRLQMEHYTFSEAQVEQFHAQHLMRRDDI